MTEAPPNIPGFVTALSSRRQDAFDAVDSTQRALRDRQGADYAADHQNEAAEDAQMRRASVLREAILHEPPTTLSEVLMVMNCLFEFTDMLINCVDENLTKEELAAAAIGVENCLAFLFVRVDQAALAEHDRTSAQLAENRCRARQAHLYPIGTVQ